MKFIYSNNFFMQLNQMKSRYFSWRKFTIVLYCCKSWKLSLNASNLTEARDWLKLICIQFRTANDLSSYFYKGLLFALELIFIVNYINCDLDFEKLSNKQVVLHPISGSMIIEPCYTWITLPTSVTVLPL